MNGVLVIDKPVGPTSFDMVARLRRAAGERRVGHAGTLDPMATGVLVCCLGEATKLVPFLMDAEKEYQAGLLLGISTDTDDADVGSRIIGRADPARLAALTETMVGEALLQQRGTFVQRPPRFSALKVDGRRMHERARDDEDLEAAIKDKARPVQVYALTIDEISLPRVTFTVRCGKGTYVRAIARDLGEALAVGAHLTSLRRLRVGRFSPADAAPLLGDAAGRGDRFGAAPRLFSPAEALSHLPAVRLSAELAADLRNGKKSAVARAAEPLADEDRHAVALGPGGELVAVLARQEQGWHIARGFTAGPPCER